MDFGGDRSPANSALSASHGRYIGGVFVGLAVGLTVIQIYQAYQLEIKELVWLCVDLSSIGFLSILVFLTLSIKFSFMSSFATAAANTVFYVFGYWLQGAF